MNRMFVRIIVALSLNVLGCSAEETASDDAGAGGTWGSSDAAAESDGATGPGTPDAGASDADMTDPANRPSGIVATIDQGAPLDVNDARTRAAREALENLDKEVLEQGFDPDDLYAVFNEFALTHFGPTHQPLIHHQAGELLDFDTDATWLHVSRNSAAVAFGTTLPVIGHIEFGRSEDALTQQTEPSERYYFTQLHHLRELEPTTNYYYRFVGRGEDGEIIISHTKSLTTVEPTDVVLVPDVLPGPPFVLDEANKTYLLTQDIAADGTALQITASGITLDLNGHTLTYANAPIADPNNNAADTAASGVWARGSGLEGLRILNGTLREGHVGNKASTSNQGLHALYLSGVDNTELAGLSIEYHGAQLLAVLLRNPTGRVHMHHNNFQDSGFEVLDRHGQGGGRPLSIIDTTVQAELENDYELNHNLVKRTRQSGLMQANLMRANEIYVDSWSTNSFAIQPHSRPDTAAGDILENRVFMTGYNAIGLGWAHLDLVVKNNLYQMESIVTGNRRYYETWGEREAISAFRITNYGSGGQVRHNLRYEDNVILGRARGGSLMRGTMFFSDATITDTVFEGNFVHLMATDDETLDVAPIVTQGVSSTLDEHEPTYYLDNILVSNVANLRFGDAYGRGNHHVVSNSTFTREGNHPDYHTIVFDGAFTSFDHLLIDPRFEGGASYDDVWWRRTSIQSFYTVQWTLSITGAPGAAVTIHDVDGTEVFSGQIDGSGKLDVPLSAVTIRPTEWTPEAGGGEVGQKFAHQRIEHSPHEVSVAGATQTVTLDARKTLTF